MTPRTLYRSVAIAEAITWALLLAGMIAKYGTRTTDLGVSIGGGLHGFVFLTFCAATVLIAVDQRWSLRRTAFGLASAIPPFATIPFERWAERRGLLGRRWRLREDAGTTHGERAISYAVRRPVGATIAIGVVVLVVFGALVALGPPPPIAAHG